MKKITFSADGNLIDAARRRAASEGTTLTPSSAFGSQAMLGVNDRPLGPWLLYASWAAS